MVGGIHRRLQVSHTTPWASRAIWLAAYSGQEPEMLFDARPRSFAALGGVARRATCDNMKTAVDKVRKTRAASSTPAFRSCARTACLTRTSATSPRLGALHRH